MRGALAKELVVSGRGLHTGRKVTARLRPVNPEAAGQGVLFRRVRHGKMLGVIPATLRAWRKLPLCSTLEGENGLQVRTVEHLLAALLICGIDDVTVDLDNEEVPILDGGAEAWILGIRGVGRTSLPVTRRFIRIKEPYSSAVGNTGRYSVAPSPVYSVDVKLVVHDFAPMAWSYEVNPETFAAEVAPARSYGHLKWVLPAFLHGLFSKTPVARGARPSCVAAICNGHVLGGMKLPNEFARHKVLDMVGDFALAGAPVLGKFTVVQPNHRRNQIFMKRILAQRSVWEWVG